MSENASPRKDVPARARIGPLITFLRPTIRRAGFYLAGSILFGVLSGAIYIEFILVLSRTVEAMARRGSSTAHPLMFLLALSIISPLAFFASRTFSVYYSQQAVLDIRSRLTRASLGLSVGRAEAIGPARLLAMLTQDVSAIGRSLPSLPLFATNGTIVVLAFAYFLWHSPQAFLLASLIVLVAGIVYHRLSRIGLAHFLAAREAQNILYRYFQLIGEGFKELRLSGRMRGRLYTASVEDTAASIARHNTLAAIFYGFGNSVARGIIFVALVALLYWSTYHHLAPAVLLTYVLFAFFLLQPVQGVVSTFPLFGAAMASSVQIQRLLDRSPKEDSPDAPSFASDGARSKAPVPTEVELRGVCFSYPADRAGYSFRVGPLDLRLKSGEIVFLTGGNGSGKTTLIKLLAGLYRPAAGDFRVNSKPLDRDQIEDYREMVSLVSTDSHLHELPWSFDLSGQAATRYEELLDSFALKQIVRAQNGRFETSGLSRGQQKRLALLAACLQDRQIYCFDEWAAEQEPTFKRRFYTEFLAELKQAEKLIVVATHDDSYFEHADVLVKMEMGQVTELLRRSSNGDAKAAV